MFNKNTGKGIKYVEENLENIKEKIENITQKIVEMSITATVDCEICGCMVRKENAVRGKMEVRERPPAWQNKWLCLTEPGFYQTPNFMEEYAYIPYYCKRCAPKEKK